MKRKKNYIYIYIYIYIFIYKSLFYQKLTFGIYIYLYLEVLVDIQKQFRSKIWINMIK